MTLVFHALWMLCALGAVVFAAAAAGDRRQLAFLTLGWTVSAASTAGGGVPSPEIVGGLTVAAALLYLFRPRLAWAAAALGGAAAGVGVGLLGVVGTPIVVSLGVTAAFLGVAVWLTRRQPAFAPEALREEALLVVCLLGLGVAVLPGVLDGWQAATSLNVPPEGRASVFPAWTVMVLATSTLLGGAYSVWSRR